MEVERTITRPISMISGARLCKFPDFPGFLFSFHAFVPFIVSFWEDPGGPKEHPGTIEDIQGPSWRQSVMK